MGGTCPPFLKYIWLSFPCPKVAFGREGEEWLDAHFPRCSFGIPARYLQSVRAGSSTGRNDLHTYLPSQKDIGTMKRAVPGSVGVQSPNWRGDPIRGRCCHDQTRKPVSPKSKGTLSQGYEQESVTFGQPEGSKMMVTILIEIKIILLKRSV